MKKKSIIIGIVVVVLLGGMVWKLAGNKKVINSHKEVKTTEEKISVTVATAQFQDKSEKLEFVGTAEPSKEVTIASESAGKIVQLNFKLGDFVNKGTVLAKVDDTYKRLAYENALTNYNKFKDDYERFQVLRKGDAVSETQLRDMKIGFENATNQLENAKKQWDDTQITAPFSGYITTKNTELGAFVNMGTPIAGIAEIAQLKVQLSVSESDVYQLHTGMEAVVTTDVYPNINYKANISNISQRGSSAHIYPIEILITNNTKSPLKAGTYVNVSVHMGKTAQSLMIPRDAIVSSVKEPSVYLVKGDNVQLTKIMVGDQHSAFIEVIQGLNEGEKVVTNGQINLMDGAKVAVINN